MNRQEMREKLQKKLTDRRFEHSLGVEYVSGCLAMVHGVNVEKALTAGLLHDCAKCLSDEVGNIAGSLNVFLENLREIIKKISECEYNNPELLHAKLGAFYAREKYDVKDPDILSAIACHTTGKPAMNMLEKILFVADYIEPNRKPLKEIEEIRKEAFTDIDKCIVHILKNTLSYLETTTDDTDPMSIDTYNYYVAHQSVADKLKEDDI